MVMKANTHQRFAVLDGLRGIAALIVVMIHGQEYLGVEFIHHGYLMVDLFFVISGFVLAAAYGDTLAKGGMGRWFMKIRLLRLYPMALLGLAIGVVFYVLAAHTVPSYRGMPSVLPLLLAGLFFVPLLAGGPISPLNIPGWSLIFEIWVNAVYGYAARTLTFRRLIVVVTLAFLGLVAAVALNHDLDVGARQRNVLGGVARVLFSFPLGILIHRLWIAGRLARLRCSAVAVWGMAPALALIALAGKSGLFDLAVVTVVFPAMIALAVVATVPRGLAVVFAAAGRISYPLYAIHGPVLLLCELGFTVLGPKGPIALEQRAAVVAGAIVLAVALAWASDRWIDAPLRAWIGARRERRFHAVAPVL